MNDASDKLALRFAELADPLDDSDWREVVRRAGVHRRSRAWLALPIAAALVALVVGSAFAYYRDVVDFLGAEKAPRETVEFFVELGVEAPPGMDPEAIASETRRIEVMTLGGERAAVFVAPTKAGGVCFIWQPAGAGGCDKHGRMPLVPGWWARPTRTDDSAGISGHVSSRYVSSVELRFSDGVVLRPPITWVSEPIGQGFFHHTFEHGEADSLLRRGFLDGWKPGHLDGGRTLTIVALDGDGNVVSTVEPCCDETAPQPEAIVSEKKIAASISTRSGPAVIWTAPTRYEGTCAWLELGGKTRSFLRCMPAGYREDGMSFRPLPTPETVVIAGTVPERYGSLVLEYADDDSQRVALGGHYLLVEIPHAHHEPETRLRTMTVYRDDGQLITTFATDVRPAAGAVPAACFRYLPLPHGQTCP